MDVDLQVGHQTGDRFRLCAGRVLVQCLIHPLLRSLSFPSGGLSFQKMEGLGEEIAPFFFYFYEHMIALRYQITDFAVSLGIYSWAPSHLRSVERLPLTSAAAGPDPSSGSLLSRFASILHTEKQEEKERNTKKSTLRH